MDFVSDLRDATLDAASAIGFAAKEVGVKLSSYTEELGDQMHIIGSNVGHELSLVAGDQGKRKEPWGESDYLHGGHCLRR